MQFLNDCSSRFSKSLKTAWYVLRTCLTYFIHGLTKPSAFVALVSKTNRTKSDKYRQQ